MPEYIVSIKIEKLEEGAYLATSDVLPAGGLPRTRKMAESFEFDGIRAIETLEFLQLEANARLARTDSGEGPGGGVHPGRALRDNAERPETLEVGANILAGSMSRRILEAVKYTSCTEKEWNNPFGNGKSAIRILDLLAYEETR